MKTTGVLLFFFLLYGSLAVAQDSVLLENFSATALNGKVYLSWVIRAGSTCNGIQIERKTGGIAGFVQIGEIPGICGSSAAPQPYSFTDEHPENNNTNTYRLNLGGLAYSEERSLLLNQIGNGLYSFRPSPASDFSCLYFDNDAHNERSLEIFSLDGCRVWKERGKEAVFCFDTAHFAPGLYLFVVGDENGAPLLRGKFLVD